MNGYRIRLMLNLKTHVLRLLTLTTKGENTDMAIFLNRGG